MIATYHNHTTYSDGKATLDEMIAAAREQGIDELGLSDHFVLHPSGRTPDWAMGPRQLAAYVQAVRSRQGGSDPVVRLGLEVDWFPGQAGAIRQALDGIDFDYLIGSVHEVDGIVIDGSATAWRRLSEDERNAVHRRYWQLVQTMAESRLFDIAAHLDLVKKFGYRATVDLDDVIEPALDAIAAAEMVVEMNTAGWHKPCQDGYPATEILRACFQRGIAVTISADAHEPDHLLRDFPAAVKRISKAGYEAVVRFDKRQRMTEHPEAAIAML